MPSSRVRCTTEYAMTPYSPTAVSASAVPANPARRFMMNRRRASVSPRNSRIGRTSATGSSRVDRMDPGDQRRREARGIAAGPYHQRHRIPGPLGLGPVEGRIRQRIDAGVVYVPDDADDGAAQGVAPRHDEALAQAGAPAR